MKFTGKLLFGAAAIGLVLIGDLIGNLLPGLPGLGKGSDKGDEKPKEPANKIEQQAAAPKEPQPTALSQERPEPLPSQIVFRVEVKKLDYWIDGNMVGDFCQLTNNIAERTKSARVEGINLGDVVFDLEALSERENSQAKIRQFVEQCGATARP